MKKFKQCDQITLSDILETKDYHHHLSDSHGPCGCRHMILVAGPICERSDAWEAQQSVDMAHCHQDFLKAQRLQNASTR